MGFLSPRVRKSVASLATRSDLRRAVFSRTTRSAFSYSERAFSPTSFGFCVLSNYASARCERPNDWPTLTTFSSHGTDCCITLLIPRPGPLLLRPRPSSSRTAGPKKSSSMILGYARSARFPKRCARAARPDVWSGTETCRRVLEIVSSPRKVPKSHRLFFLRRDEIARCRRSQTCGALLRP
jgi:hypothetical protein